MEPQETLLISFFDPHPYNSVPVYANVLGTNDRVLLVQ